MSQVFPMNFRLWRYLGLPESVPLDELPGLTPAAPPRAIPGSGFESEKILEAQTRVQSRPAHSGVASLLPNIPKRLLVADDGGPASKTALADAEALGRKYKAELKVAHVTDDAAHALTELAAASQASWIVMGSRGQNLKDEVKSGSVSETVMKEADVPVWIAKPSPALEIKRILVAVDGTPPSARVASQGLRLASDFNAEMCLLHVGDSKSDALPLPEVFSKIASQKTTVTEIPARDSIAATILQCARDIDATLIIMGTHREARSREILASGVAAEVVRGSPCRLLILHPYEPN